MHRTMFPTFVLVLLIWRTDTFKTSPALRSSNLHTYLLAINSFYKIILPIYFVINKIRLTTKTQKNIWYWCSYSQMYHMAYIKICYTTPKTPCINKSENTRKRVSRNRIGGDFPNSSFLFLKFSTKPSTEHPLSSLNYENRI